MEKEMLDAYHRVNGLKSKPRLDHVIEYFGESCRALAITSDRIERYKAHRLELGAAPGTINLGLASLRRAFNLAVEAKRLPDAPHIKLLPERNVRRGFLTEAQYKKLLKELPDYLKPALTFAWWSGWRKAEITGLRWADVDLKDGVIRLEGGRTKGGEPRLFPFGEIPELQDLLERQRERTKRLERETGKIVPWVFWYRGGQPLGDFRKAWASACVRAGLGHWTNPKKREGYIGLIFHDLRRSTARRLVKRGVPEIYAMRLLGQKTRSIFERYAISSEEDLRVGLRRLAGRPERPDDEQGVDKVVDLQGHNRATVATKPARSGSAGSP